MGGLAVVLMPPNPCYKQYGIIAQNSNRRTEPFSFLFLSDGKNNFEKIKI